MVFPVLLMVITGPECREQLGVQSDAALWAVMVLVLLLLLAVAGRVGGVDDNPASGALDIG